MPVPVPVQGRAEERVQGPESAPVLALAQGLALGQGLVRGQALARVLALGLVRVRVLVLVRAPEQSARRAPQPAPVRWAGCRHHHKMQPSPWWRPPPL